MKVILLAAGFGTRLRPLTNNIPKCLVPIKGKPLLEIWLEKLIGAGCEKILINTHYLSNQVEEYIKKSKYNINCIIKHEEVLLGTAGTLLANLDYIKNDDCLLIHADNFTNVNINDFISAHKKRPSESLMTMMTFKTEKPEDCGIVRLNEKNIAITFDEKSKNNNGNIANAAIYILTNELIFKLKNHPNVLKDFSTQVIPLFINKIYCWESKGIFIDIGNINNYNIANRI